MLRNAALFMLVAVCINICISKPLETDDFNGDTVIGHMRGKTLYQRAETGEIYTGVEDSSDNNHGPVSFGVGRTRRRGSSIGHGKYDNSVGTNVATKDEGTCCIVFVCFPC
jgi:hypothetical protein